MRTRHGLANGDFGRIERQQNFLRTIMDSMLSTSTFINPIKLAKVVGTVSSFVQVDDTWSTGDIRNLAIDSKDLRAGNVQFTTAPFGGYDTIGGQSIVRLDAAKTQGAVPRLRPRQPDRVPQGQPGQRAAGQPGRQVAAPTAAGYSGPRRRRSSGSSRPAGLDRRAPPVGLTDPPEDSSTSTRRPRTSSGFFRSAEDLQRLPALVDSIFPAGGLWIAWPRRARATSAT